MIVLRQGQTQERWPREPAQLRGCSLQVVTLTYAQARELAETMAVSGVVIEEAQQAKLAEFARRYIVRIDGLVVEDVPVTPENLLDVAPAWVCQALFVQVLRGSSLEGQQGLDSRRPSSGGGTASGGTAPPVIDVPSEDAG